MPVLHYETTESSQISVPRKEVYRYLGYRGVEPSREVSSHIEPCIAKMIKQSHLQAVWLSTPLEQGLPNQKHKRQAQSGRGLPEPGQPEQSNDSSTFTTVTDKSVSLLHILDMDIVSKSLSRNLSGCSEVVLMAATIGPGIDFLIRRAEAVSMLDAAIYQAAGAAYVESWCDEVNSRINHFMGEIGFYGHPRFSPGYGDLPLSLQKDFSRILDMPKNCGISLTDTLLMTPSKSVTAFIGYEPIQSGILADEPAESSSNECSKKQLDKSKGCSSCENVAHCEYRR